MDSVQTLWFALRLEATVKIKKICLEDEDVFYSLLDNWGSISCWVFSSASHSVSHH